jgi:hypothetical protein
MNQKEISMIATKNGILAVTALMFNLAATSAPAVAATAALEHV